jgi:hypothetical protein
MTKALFLHRIATALLGFVVIILALPRGSDAEPSLDRINEFVQLKEFPIHFDKQLNEYQLVHKRPDGLTSYFPLAFCPWTGAKLPASLRDSAFDEVDNGEIRSLSRRLAGVKSLQDVARNLGPADHLFTNSDGGIQLTYTKLAKTVEVVIVQTGKELMIGYPAKAKEPASK